MQTKNIIFDLGGVLLNIDYDRTADAFNRLGFSDFTAVYSQSEQAQLFSELETGKISNSAFCSRLKEAGNIDVRDEEIISAWNAMLLDFPPERFEFLNEIKQRYNSILLSNTNAIHLEAFSKIIRVKNGMEGLETYFHRVHYSHILGMRKPDPYTFRHVLQMNGFKPEETIFIDDSMQHIYGAKEAGIRSIWLDTAHESVQDKLGFLLA